MSVARFIADQRTFYRVPYAVCAVILAGERVMVLQVDQPAGHRAPAAPGGAGWARWRRCSTYPSAPTARLACMPTCFRPLNSGVLDGM